MASPSRPLCRCLVGPTRPLHPCHRSKALSTELGIQMPSGVTYVSTQRRCPEAHKGCPPQFLPTSGAAEAGRRMRGQGTVEAASMERRSHGRAYWGPRSWLSLFVRCATLRSDTWTGPDLGLSAGGGQRTPRGCSNGDRKASLVLWAGSGAAEGRGWRGAGSGLSLLGRSGRGRRRNGRGLVWGWGRKGAGAGAGRGLGSGRGACGGRV